MDIDSDYMDDDYVYDHSINWYGVATDGSIGLFMSEGTAIHSYVRKSISAQRICNTHMRSLPIVCKCTRDPNTETYVKSYLSKSMRKVYWGEPTEMARRGFYVYLSSHDYELEIDEPYRRLIMPDRPLKIDMVMQDIAEYIKNIQVPIIFGDTEFIQHSLII